MMVKYLVLSAVLLFSQMSLGQSIFEGERVTLPWNVELFLKFEMIFNNYNENIVANGIRSPRELRAIRLEYFELPVELVDIKINVSQLRTEVQDSLVFEKNGQQWVRWFFNPEDEMYRDKILAHFRESSGRELELQSGRFAGFLTASRSTVVKDLKTGALFSMKASTNRTGGPWQGSDGSKRLRGATAEYGVETSNYIEHNLPTEGTNLRFAPEFASLKTKSLADYGVSFRDYEMFYNSDVIYIPFFSVFNDRAKEVFGLVMDNLVPKNLVEFWRNKVSVYAGRAFGDLVGHLGLIPHSAHNQDLLLIVRNGQLTEEVLLRDLNDLIPVSEIVSKKVYGDRILSYSRSVGNSFEFIFQPFMGSQLPHEIVYNESVFNSGGKAFLDRVSQILRLNLTYERDWASGIFHKFRLPAFLHISNESNVKTCRSLF
ncbi:MAG: hypothetical protein CL677_00725 [Bdellovibrionaceae bacterium]|nr:hypothetical protein [Pseudobdellovibrionaceae bacterium]|tara:strand:- start:69889 stop:71178 length:1290 start_codon:yes stop_codon:yes gene_type:complete